ncbi:MAG: hypothetical protein ACF8R9_11545 [Phycisphaerales bacterium JB054]
MNIPDVAKYQKFLIFAILGQIVMYALQIWSSFAAGSAPNAGAATAVGLGSLVIGLVSLGLAIFAIVSLVLLMTALERPIVMRVLGAIAMLIPLVGLIVLLVVNQRATDTLKANGVSVGLLGARSI